MRMPHFIANNDAGNRYNKVEDGGLNDRDDPVVDCPPML
jgi:hypothetical protein